MATKPTTRITQAEIIALTDRLHARANSRLFNDQPETKLDIRLAARLLKHLIETGVIYHPLELT
jgi:hypothetical protein